MAKSHIFYNLFFPGGSGSHLDLEGSEVGASSLVEYIPRRLEEVQPLFALIQDAKNHAIHWQAADGANGRFSFQH